jgi:CheY-like chemotaxis protein
MARILITGDKEAALKMFRYARATDGQTVDETPDGQAEFTLLREKPAEVIFTDMRIPKGNGLEVMVELKRWWPEIKVTARTGGAKRGKSIWGPRLSFEAHKGCSRGFVRGPRYDSGDGTGMEQPAISTILHAAVKSLSSWILQEGFFLHRFSAIDPFQESP